MTEQQPTSDFWIHFDEIIDKAIVPCFSTNTVRPCAEDDFTDFRKTLPINLNRILIKLKLLRDLDNRLLTTENKKRLVKVVAIIGEQNSKNVWNTSETIQISKKITELVCEIFGKNEIYQIFNDHIFMAMVMYLRPKLLKNTWKSYPSAVVCYKWLLQTIEKPFLKRHIKEVLPTALMIFDDYVQENQMIGLQCIGVIIDHCHKSRSLTNLNYDEVILQAFEKASLRVEPNMIILLYTTIAKLLENIRHCKGNSNLFGWNKYDDILAILFDKMELESNEDCRYGYIISLHRILNHSSMGKWSERLARILSEYCENESNLKNTSVSLDFVEAFLSIYQPKGINFYTSMYYSLLKLCYNQKNSDEGSKEILEKTEKCINLLNKLCPNLSKEIAENDIIKSIINVQ